MHAVLHPRAPFLLKMVLCVNFMARCTLFIPEKCYGRLFRAGANALVQCAGSRRTVIESGRAREIHLIRNEIRPFSRSFRAVHAAHFPTLFLNVSGQSWTNN
jgi:hypothetical protein